MKKLLLVLSATFLFSCSNESNLNNPENIPLENNPVTAARILPPVENPTDAMFHEYVTSAIFTETSQLITDFSNDMNVNFAEVNINTEAEILSWISGNIAQTEFSGVSEAYSRWNHIKERKLIELQQFPHIFEFIKTAPENQAIAIIDKWLIEASAGPVILPTCDEKLNKCSKEASAKYYYSIQYLDMTDMEGAKAESIASAKRENDMKGCRDSYKKCMGL